MRKFYSIMTPEFDTTSGGIRVMYGLYGALLLKGEVVYLNATSKDKDFIAIYPEIYQGNPSGANTVVRYILAPPGEMSLNGVQGQTDFGASDMIYYFSELFGTPKNRDHLLFLPIINMHVFKDQHKSRTRTCYLVGKGTNQNKHPKDSIELTREFANDQQALADLLNECHTLYCYDRRSAMMEVARLCGCKVKYYGDYTRDQMKLYEPGLNGISFGDDDVPLDTKGFTLHYRKLKGNFFKKLDDFISATQR